MSGLRTGFIMRTFLPLGPLTVSRGLGGFGEAVVEPVVPGALVPGRRAVRLSVSKQKSPRPLLRHVKKTGC